MSRRAPTNDSSEIRRLRLRVQRSQPEFARLLGVSAETYRTWDWGRRTVRDQVLDKARALAAINNPDRRWSLRKLATELGVHVRTLREAARSGRLAVTTRISARGSSGCAEGQGCVQRRRREINPWLKLRPSQADSDLMTPLLWQFAE